MRSLAMQDGKITKASATQSFVEDYLSKVFKLSKVCNSDNLAKCEISGAANTYQYPNSGGFVTLPVTNAAYKNFGITNDSAKVYGAQNASGVSMLIAYDSTCNQNDVCVNVVYDVNGTGAPNVVGRDVGF